MRHFIKYVLVTAVLFLGFHAASRFKAPSPQQSTANVAESETAALSSHPDAQPTGRASEWRAPVAALSDMERSTEDAIEAESHNTFKRPTLQRQATIEKSPSLDPFGSVDDWTSKNSSRWEQESSDRKSEDSLKPNMQDRPNGRKKPSAAKESRSGKKAQESDRYRKGGKTDDDKRARQPLESARGDRGMGSKNATSRQAKSAPATPEWPIGERLASSSKTPSTQQLRKENQWPWEEKPDAASRRNSPFGRDRDGEDESQFRSNDDMDQVVPDRGRPRRPEKPIQPTKDDQRLRTAEDLKRHRIVDGDTLPKLAVAYLGDRDRYLDIFQANRDVLSDPRLLPIGAEIAIPAGKKRSSGQSARPSRDEKNQTEWTADDGELVPIPTFALPPRISR